MATKSSEVRHELQPTLNTIKARHEGVAQGKPGLEQLIALIQETNTFWQFNLDSFHVELFVIITLGLLDA